MFPDGTSPVLNMALLTRLRDADGQFVALADLGEDRARVWDDLEALARFGYLIERHPYLGAAYRGPTERLCPDQIEHGLATRSIGRRIVVWNRVASTNDLAAAAGTTPANHGLVILAEEQTAGRGQQGRRWTAPARSSLLMSVLLFPPSRLTARGQGLFAGTAWLTALGAVVVAEAVSRWTGRDARIKWPNDVRIDHRKIAGILVERVLAPDAAEDREPGTGEQTTNRAPRARGVVIGIGLNVSTDPEVFPPDLRPRVTTLKMLAPDRVIDRSLLAHDLIVGLDHWYHRVLDDGPESLVPPWRSLSEHLDRRVSVTTPGGQFRGRLIDLGFSQGVTLAAEEPAGSSLRIALGDVLAIAGLD